jgi:MFS superfamily sulfate permease-like transporter
MEQKQNKVYRWLRSKEFAIIVLQNLIFALITGLILASFQVLIQNQQNQKARKESISRVDVSMLTSQRDEFTKKMSQYFLLLYQLAGKVKEADSKTAITEIREDCESSESNNDSKLIGSESCSTLYNHLTKLTTYDLNSNKMILVNTIEAFNYSNSSTNSEKVSKELDSLISDLADLNVLIADRDKFMESYDDDRKFCSQNNAGSELCQALDKANQTFVSSLKTINESLINAIDEK